VGAIGKRPHSIKEEKMFEQIYTVAKDLITAAKQVNDLKLSREALLRSYYVEVRSNLDILDVLDTEKLKALPVNDPRVFSMLACLETQIAASILCSSDEVAKKLYSFFSTAGKVDNVEEDKKKKKNTKTVLEAVQFTMQKIIVLQKLSTVKMEDDKDVLKTLRLGKRVDNIKQNLLFIAGKIKALDKTGAFLPLKKGA
jgi:hypothetical protein